MPHWTHMLAFEDERPQAQALADALGVPCSVIRRHRFPDGEWQLTLPPQLEGAVLLWRSLHQPNEKLVELLIAAPAARELGATAVWLVAPYLAYMRQDIAFHPGEAVSQRHVGALLGGMFDGLVTVDPHLHRIASLDEVLPAGHRGIGLSAAGLLGAFVASQVDRPLLLGPDGEAEQWVKQAAHRGGGGRPGSRTTPPPLDHAWCTKVRLGDHDVRVALPDDLAVRGRAVVLIDDMASTGRTLIAAAQLCLAGGATSVDVAVTHALFVGDAVERLKCAGVRHVWSTDCVPHASNAVSIVALLAQALAPSPSSEPQRG